MLVSDLILAVMPRLGRAEDTSGISIYQAANSIQSLIFKNLLNRKSDLLATGNLSLTIPAYGYYATLPDDFISMAERPYSEDLADDWMAGVVVSYDDETGELVFNATSCNGSSEISSWNIAQPALPGSPAYNIGTSSTTVTTSTGEVTLVTQAGLNLSAGDYLLIYSGESQTGYEGIEKVLEPNYLSNDQAEDHTLPWYKSYVGNAGVRPEKFKIIDDTFYVTPHVAVNTKISGKYNQMPVDLTLPTQTIPWKGKFDEIFREGVALVVTKGVAILEDNTSFLTFFNREFEYVMNGRARLIPQGKRVARNNFL